MGSVKLRDCTDHWCDSCATCSKGRCCRSDDPTYRLPELGSIQPFSGELGVRRDLDDKVECHVCGGWFQSVASHSWIAHDLTALEYKAAFGLMRKGLISETYRRRMSDLRRRSYKGQLSPHAITPEQRRYARRSIEGAAVARSAAYRHLIPAGHSPTALAKMRATKKQQSIQYQETRTCPECGKAFTAQTWQKAVVCSKACRRTRSARLARESMLGRIAAGNAPVPPPMTDEIRQKLSKKAVARWSHATDQDRANAKHRLMRYQESLSPEQLTAQRSRAGNARAAQLRQPHYCTAGCGTWIPTANPKTCSPECRKKVRQATAAKVAAAKVRSGRSL